MAYGDYGAEVFCNGNRREDKEHCVLFDSRKSMSLKDGYRLCHGVMGDGDIRVQCYKQGLPTIYEWQDGVEHEINYDPEEKYDYFDYEVRFDYKGYHFYFESGSPYYASMTEPDGTNWDCYYDYGYGESSED